jgi:hypothetical protein
MGGQTRAELIEREKAEAAKKLELAEKPSDENFQENFQWSWSRHLNASLGTPIGRDLWLSLPRALT